jgi:hypothetical protein
MTRSLTIVAMAAMLLCGAALTAKAQPGAGTTRPDERIVYVPPPHSTPGMRVNSTSRGAADDMPVVYFLSPDHVGLTLQEKPTVLWYLSKSTAAPCVLTLTEDNQPEPAIEIHLDGSKAGVRRTDFHGQTFGLKLNVQYQLSLALVQDPQHRSNDRYCSAYIERIQPSASFLAKLATRARPEDRAVVYAREGIWYDALEVLSDQIDSHPDNDSSREQRADLLEQVNLPEAASFDRASESGK